MYDMIALTLCNRSDGISTWSYVAGWGTAALHDLRLFPGLVTSLIRIQKRCHAGLFAALFLFENASDDARKDSLLEQVTSKDAHSIIASYCNQSGAIKCLRICFFFFFQDICGLYIQWNKNLEWECHQFQDLLSTASETWWFENIWKSAPIPFFYQQDFSGLIKEASTKASRYVSPPPFPIRWQPLR